ncbi:hypothetical protein TRFO_31533 [Tritrichomonas foetus]|uniref:Uncharacterized protein n=1 Tax=Tritrichomonas foetus TaxID=1144522 RepID=A0A1J4JVK3_9EUKA|nr:hypothetical protein TRFO_31533 [Tritrichomonas foetus]|eukprot:OHT01558.1 hypothetical protein TRFO_31533 [Tritrichomonas foetus]
MNESMQSFEIIEIQSHLSTIQDSVDNTLQGIGNRNGLLNSGSQKYFKFASDLKERLTILQRYSAALRAKHHEMKIEIDQFHNKVSLNLAEIKSVKNEMKRKYLIVENLYNQIIDKQQQNIKNRDLLNIQITEEDKEMNYLDEKLHNLSQFDFTAHTSSENDVLNKEIFDLKVEVNLLDEQLAFKNKIISDMNSSNNGKSALKAISESLFTIKRRSEKITEECFLINEKMNLIKHNIDEKKLKLENIKEKIKKLDEKSNIKRSDITNIKAIIIKIEAEKEKSNEANQEITNSENKLRRIKQELEIENKNEIDISHKVQKFNDEFDEYDPNSNFYKNYEKSENEYTLLCQAVDDAVILNAKLQNQIECIDKNAMIAKEKIHEEINECVHFNEQKLYTTLRSINESNRSMKKEVKFLEQSINVLEAEKMRLDEKYQQAKIKLEKYQKKEKKKPKGNNHKDIKKLKSFTKALEFKLSNLLCIIDHKKEDIETMKTNYEQMMIRMNKSSCSDCCTSKILAPICPIMQSRQNIAQILCDTTSKAKNIFENQKIDWKQQEQKDIENKLKRWDDTLTKISPTFENRIMKVIIEHACQ